MFSNTSEYALRAIVHLAAHQGGLLSAPAIAEVTKVPPKYLSKILNDLVDANLVTSRRGPGGGFELAKDPTRISILDVVNAVDPIRRIETCPLGIPSHGTNLCRLHKKLDQTIAMVEDTLRDASILDMGLETEVSPPPLRAPSQPTISAKSKSKKS